MKPEIKSYLDAHGDDPRPAIRQALLAEGHSPEELDDAFAEWDRSTVSADPVARRATFDRLAAIFHLVGLGWVAYWLLILPDKIAEGRALTALLVVGMALVVAWLISTFIGRWLLPRTGLAVALIVPALTALVVTFGMFNLMGGRM
jgi:hypothetical protein